MLFLQNLQEREVCCNHVEGIRAYCRQSACANSYDIYGMRQGSAPALKTHTASLRTGGLRAGQYVPGSNSPLSQERSLRLFQI